MDMIFGLEISRSFLLSASASIMKLDDENDRVYFIYSPLHSAANAAQSIVEATSRFMLGREAVGEFKASWA